MPKLYLLLGSNLGDRRANLETALERLDALFGPRLAQSSVAETEAVGFAGPAFLNTVVCYRTRRAPLCILRAVKQIEWEMGRRDAPEYGPDGGRIYHSRIIDIDLLRYGRLEMSTPELTLPHPQVAGRAFVAPLLAEIERK